MEGGGKLREYDREMAKMSQATKQIEMNIMKKLRDLYRLRNSMYGVGECTIWNNNDDGDDGDVSADNFACCNTNNNNK